MKQCMIHYFYDCRDHIIHISHQSALQSINHLNYVKYFIQYNSFSYYNIIRSYYLSYELSNNSITQKQQIQYNFLLHQGQDTYYIQLDLDKNYIYYYHSFDMIFSGNLKQSLQDNWLCIFILMDKMLVNLYLSLLWDHKQSNFKHIINNHKYHLSSIRLPCNFHGIPDNILLIIYSYY